MTFADIRCAQLRKTLRTNTFDVRTQDVSVRKRDSSPNRLAIWSIALGCIILTTIGCNTFTKDPRTGFARGQDLGEPPVFVNADEPATWGRGE